MRIYVTYTLERLRRETTKLAGEESSETRETSPGVPTGDGICRGGSEFLPSLSVAACNHARRTSSSADQLTPDAANGAAVTSMPVVPASAAGMP